jgi:hypothetical protein
MQGLKFNTLFFAENKNLRDNIYLIKQLCLLNSCHYIFYFVQMSALVSNFLSRNRLKFKLDLEFK